MEVRCLGCMELYEDEYGICPHCGYVRGSEPEEAIHMLPGTILKGRYIVGKVVGYGGFGVTYIGWDQVLEQKVAIKEYLPSEFSTRVPGSTAVSVFNGDKTNQFHDGLEKFISEAKRLAKFQNEPGIVKVFDSFGENGTAYIIMEYLEGETLGERLKREGTISEKEAVQILIPVMHSLETVHKEGIIHRDIAPDNIFITTDGEAKLIDFGASRYATTSHSRSITVIIKQGFSPEEQYRSRGDQGPHTDVYGLAATLYKMITGQTPPDAMERRVSIETNKKDLLVEPHKTVKGISLNTENAILNALNVRIEDRTPDTESFLGELTSEVPVKRRYGNIKKIDFYRWPKWLKIAMIAAAGVIAGFGLLLATGVIDFQSLYVGKIEVPEGMVAVPDVEGMTKQEAINKLKAVKLNATSGGSIESQYVEADSIVLQSPNAGAYLEEYGQVVITVSAGSGVVETVDGVSTVPYLIWNTVDEAREKLSKAGLSEPEVSEEYDEIIEAGQIISQDPEAGTKVPEGSKISITVSLGAAPFELPDVTGMEVTEARKMLGERALQVRITYIEAEGNDIGKVMSQLPEKNSSVKKGDEIVLTVGQEKETETAAVNVSENVTSVPTLLAKPTMHRVYFDAGEGECEESSREVASGNPIGALPKAVREGYTLKGWFYGDSKVSSSTKVTSDMDVYAEWEIESIVFVYFDAGSGDVDEEVREVKKGNAIGTLPVPRYDNHVFDGWYDGDTKISSSTKVTEELFLEAKWKGDTVFTVWFDAAGGNVSEESRSVKEGSQIGTLPKAERDGFVLKGWYCNGEKISSATRIKQDMDVYAEWEAVKKKEYTIRFFVSSDERTEYQRTVAVGDCIGDLPVPDREGYEFSHWDYNGKWVTPDTVVESDMRLLAIWIEKAPAEYTVYLDPNGGYCSQTERRVKAGQPVGKFPEAERDGFFFVGWSLFPDEMVPGSGDYIMPDGDLTLYAYWKEPEFGPWSDWQEEPVEETATRQVEGKEVVVSVEMQTLCCGNSAGYRCWLPYRQKGYTVRAEMYYYTMTKDQFDASTVWPQGSYFDRPDSNNCDGYIIGPGDAYHAPGLDVPYYINKFNTAYMYRYRELEN